MNKILSLPTSPTAGGVYLAVVAVALGAWYLILHPRIWPWTRCRRCLGAGRLRSPEGGSWRDCPRCEGSGKRRRPLAGREDAS